MEAVLGQLFLVTAVAKIITAWKPKRWRAEMDPSSRRKTVWRRTTPQEHTVVPRQWGAWPATDGRIALGNPERLLAIPP